MTKTKNYQLTQWEPGDPIRRQDFNRDNAVVDGVLAGLARMEAGEYTGTGTYGRSAPSTLCFGFKPRVIVISYLLNMSSAERPTHAILFQGLSKGYSWQYSAATEVFDVTWEDDAVSWYSIYSARDQLNLSGTVYRYAAFG
jgi:hypothetical protein